MQINYEYSFELKPGKLVFIQTKEAAVRSKRIIKAVLKRYFPDQVFHHFKRGGGHVGALKRHLEGRYFSTFDIDDFFGRVTRTRLARALRHIGIPSNRAFEWAFESVVVSGNRKVLPFGFRQSPLLATLVLECSALGVELKRLHEDGLTVSVYMDDIVISGSDRETVLAASARIMAAAEIAQFPLAENKVAISVAQATAFNIHIQEHHVEFTEERLERFARDFPYLTEAGQESVQRYALAVGDKELSRLKGAVGARQREEAISETEFTPDIR